MFFLLVLTITPDIYFIHDFHTGSSHLRTKSADTIFSKHVFLDQPFGRIFCLPITQEQMFLNE